MGLCDCHRHGCRRANARRHTLGGTIGAICLLALEGCFAPDLGECQVTCAQSCPAPLECREGWCVQPGSAMSCAAEEEGSAANHPAGAAGAMSLELAPPTAAVGAGGASGAAGAGGRILRPPLSCADGVLTSSRLLPMACSGASYRAQLRAECAQPPAERPTHWSSKRCPDAGAEGCLPPWLTLSPDGVLSGVAPAGSARLRIDVTVTLDTSVSLEPSLELEVSDRCWAFAMTGSAPAQLSARRLDGEDALEGFVALREGESVSEFELSRDGRFLLARVAGAAGVQRPALYEVGGVGVRELSLEGSVEPLLAHAFSPNGEWLALVSGAPETASLHVVRLGQSPLQLGEPRTIDYVAGLVWSTPSIVLYLGRSVQFISPQTDEPLPTPHEVAISATGIAAGMATQERAYLNIEPTVVDFYGFLPNEHGFFIETNQALAYFDRCVSRMYSAHVIGPEGGSLSPTFQWVAETLDGQTSLQQYGSVPDAGLCLSPPDTPLAVRCTEPLAWSADGTLLLCANQGALSALQVGSVAPEQRPLAPELTYQPLRTRRRAVSARGRWIALDMEASDAHPGGVYVLDTSQSNAPARLALSAPADGVFTDLAFSADERLLVVHQGAKLSVLPAGAGEVREISSGVKPVPVCKPDGLPDQSTWCGASGLLPGPVVLSNAGHFVAFEEQAGATAVADMTLPGSRLELGSTTPGCSERKTCVRFQ